MSAKEFTDVFCRNIPEPVYGYRSALAVYEERFLNNTLVAGGWNGAGYPLNVLTNCPTFTDHFITNDPSVFHVELDGVCVDYMLENNGIEIFEKKNGSKEAVITVKSSLKPVEIKVHTLMDGSSVFTRWLEIKNLSDKPMALSRLSVMSGLLQQRENVKGALTPDIALEDMYEIGYFECDEWGFEGDLVWKKLQMNKTTIAGRFSRERYRYPAVFIKNTITGEIFFAQLGWSGGYEFGIDNIVNKNRIKHVTLGFDVAITGFKPLRVIDAGETFVSPKVHIGCVIGTMDDVTNETYRHIRKSVLTMPETKSECLVGAGMGPEHDMSVETTKRYADQMAKCGAEVFIVDAGWYCPPGTEMKEWHSRAGYYHEDKDRYPNGIKEIRDYIHSKGMKFGMWMEPERVGAMAPCFEEHPDWYVKPPFSRPVEGFIDFTNPDAVAWVESEIARVITEYELDLFRIDNNMGSSNYFCFTGGEIPEGGAVRHFEEVYAMYERLKKRFPDVIFENCAGGGGRTDLGMVKAFNHSWVSDWQKAPRSVYITNGITHVLPPEKVDRLVAGMGCHEYGSLDFHMRNAMLGHVTLNVFSPIGAEHNEEQIEFIKHSVKVYKDFIRPMISDARMYHHTEDTPSAREEGYLVMELASAKRDKAAITVFTLPGWNKNNVTVFPRGVDLSGDYKVTLDNSGESFMVSGRELLTQGVSTLPLGTMTSELILIEKM